MKKLFLALFAILSISSSCFGWCQSAADCDCGERELIGCNTETGECDCG